MDLWFATFNSNKIKEVQTLTQDRFPFVHWHFPQEIPAYSAPEESGDSFEKNAFIKARSLRAVVPKSHWVCAEDSGLVVPSLGGMPGIHSSHYAGAKASDSENIAKLLKMLQIRRIVDRSAYYVAVIALLPPKACEPHFFKARWNGSIALKPAGKLGFGYDPIFIPEGHSQTTAELGPAIKLQASHRSQAVLKMMHYLKSEWEKEHGKTI